MGSHYIIVYNKKLHEVVTILLDTDYSESIGDTNNVDTGQES